MSNEKEKVFKKGDWIVHSYHGVSKIEGIDKKKIEGKERTFFKVKTEDLTYWVPIGETNVQHIRPVSSDSTLKKALSTMRRKPIILGKDYRARKVRIQQGFENGSLNAKAELIRDLNGRCYKNRENIYEEKMLEKLKQQFVDELTVSLGCERSKAKQSLEEALNKSISKLEI